METTEKKKTTKSRTSVSNLFSNTYEKESISMSAVCGFLTIIIPLVLISCCVVFYFFNVSEAANVITIINSLVAVLGIGSGVIVGRKVSSDFGPNNRIIIEGRKEERKNAKKDEKETDEES